MQANYFTEDVQLPVLFSAVPVHSGSHEEPERGAYDWRTRFSHLYCGFSLAYIGYGEATRVISDESIFHCILQLFRAEAWGTGECHFCRR